MAHHGQAESYYSAQDQDRYQAPQEPPPQSYQQYEQPQYQQPQQAPQQFSQGGHEQKYAQNPPSYGQNFSAPQEGKQDFAQTFVVQKPKYNDLWAGLLLIATFCGFVAISGLSIYRYSKYKGFSGGTYHPSKTPVDFHFPACARSSRRMPSLTLDVVES